jgi:hypothetical protein
MNRRGFLGMLGVAAVAPTYFFAPIGGWKSDLILNPADLPKPQIITTPWVEYRGRYCTIKVYEGLADYDLIVPRRVPRTSMRELPQAYTAGRIIRA